MDPIGITAATAAEQRAARSEEYRAAREEYARIAELREVDPIAAHLRERRYELGFTLEEVATAMGTTPGVISGFESGTETPSVAALEKLAVMLDRELLDCFEPDDGHELARVLARLGITEP
jgi:ribosome-binding protein aMBF1 (putative translation factor)